MDNNYAATEKYWNGVFKNKAEFHPRGKLSPPELEQALQWLCRDASTVLDFGCGHGHALARCFDYGVEHITGLDVSQEAIELARRVLKKHGYQSRSTLICGGLDALKAIKETPVDAVILFNVLDNLLPRDAEEVLAVTGKIVSSGGKMLIKLNPYFEPGVLASEEGFTRVNCESGAELYREDSGLYLWNMSNEEVKKLVNPHWVTVNYLEIELKGGLTNRIYFLEKTS